MDDVIRGQQHAHLLAHGDDQGLVHFQQIGLALGRTPFDLIARRRHAGEETYAFTFALQVVVAPLPLITGRLDGDVGVGGVLHVDHGAGRGPGHAEQNQDGDDGPRDLHHRVLMEMRRNRTLGFAVIEHRPEHHPEYANEDDQADHHQPGVHVVDLLRDAGDRCLQVVARWRVLGERWRDSTKGWQETRDATDMSHEHPLRVVVLASQIDGAIAKNALATRDFDKCQYIAAQYLISAASNMRSLAMFGVFPWARFRQCSTKIENQRGSSHARPKHPPPWRDCSQLEPADNLRCKPRIRLPIKGRWAYSSSAGSQ